MLCDRCQREIEELYPESADSVILHNIIVYPEGQNAKEAERPARKNQGRAIRVQPTGDQSAKSGGGGNPVFIGLDGRSYRQTSMDEYVSGLDSR